MHLAEDVEQGSMGVRDAVQQVLRQDVEEGKDIYDAKDKLVLAIELERIPPESTDRESIKPVTEKKQWLLGAQFGQIMPHHAGIKALWETKWKFPCSKSLYPFHDGVFADFEPVFQYLIENDINDGYGDEYTEAFFPIAESLITQADELMSLGGEDEKQNASRLYLRAACLYRIARFPYISSFPTPTPGPKWKAWTRQKEIYLRAASTWACPVTEEWIPHHAPWTRDRSEIPVYVRLPKHTSSGPPPVVLLVTGLDGYRPDNTGRLDEFLKHGWATVVAEIPGTADCPCDPADPLSPDRLFTSILDWMAAQDSFDMHHVMVWGLSAGGYYAIRVAHTHRERLRGAIAQGAGCHHFFDKAWIEGAEGREYPFELAPAMAAKHGYASIAAFKAEAQKKFSLLENGILDGESCRLLLVNGTGDGLMPIEDSLLPFQHGGPKEGRFFEGALHMGYPRANEAIYPWMESVMDTGLLRFMRL